MFTVFIIVHYILTALQEFSFCAERLLVQVLVHVLLLRVPSLAVCGQLVSRCCRSSRCCCQGRSAQVECYCLASIEYFIVPVVFAYFLFLPPDLLRLTCSIASWFACLYTSGSLPFSYTAYGFADHAHWSRPLSPGSDCVYLGGRSVTGGRDAGPRDGFHVSHFRWWA